MCERLSDGLTFEEIQAVAESGEQWKNGFEPPVFPWKNLVQARLKQKNIPDPFLAMINRDGEE